MSKFHFEYPNNHCLSPFHEPKYISDREISSELDSVTVNDIDISKMTISEPVVAKPLFQLICAFNHCCWKDVVRVMNSIDLCIKSSKKDITGKPSEYHNCETLFIVDVTCKYCGNMDHTTFAIHGRNMICTKCGTVLCQCCNADDDRYQEIYTIPYQQPLTTSAELLCRQNRKKGKQHTSRRYKRKQKEYAGLWFDVIREKFNLSKPIIDDARSIFNKYRDCKERINNFECAISGCLMYVLSQDISIPQLVPSENVCSKCFVKFPNSYPLSVHEKECGKETICYQDSRKRFYSEIPIPEGVDPDAPIVKNYGFSHELQSISENVADNFEYSLENKRRRVN